MLRDDHFDPESSPLTGTAHHRQPAHARCHCSPACRDADVNPRTTRMDEFRRARDEVQRMNSAERQRAVAELEAPSEGRDRDESEGGSP